MFQGRFIQCLKPWEWIQMHSNAHALSKLETTMYQTITVHDNMTGKHCYYSFI